MTLAADIDILLTKATLEAFKLSSSSRPGEVDFLKAFFKKVVPDLEPTLNRHAAPLGLRSDVSAMFVHQRPYVSFDPPNIVKSPPTCELGDLLILVRARSSGPPVYNALLLQGKVGDGATWRPSGTQDWLQYDLYNRWPEFWWRYCPYWEESDHKSRRHAEPASPNAGGQYLMINVDNKLKTAEWRAMQASIRGGTRPFADVLADVTMRLSGRRFCAWAKARDRIGWDRIIWDLIRSAWAPASRHHAWRYDNVKDVYRVGLAPPLLTESLGSHVASAWLSLPALTEDAARAASDEGDTPPGEGPEPIEHYPWAGGGISTVFIDLRSA